MTLQEIPSEQFRERSIPVLETERLVLRAPRLGDAKTVMVLANDRRIAENTARIPHPYRMADAEDFIATANLGNEAVFFIALRRNDLAAFTSRFRLRKKSTVWPALSTARYRHTHCP